VWLATEGQRWGFHPVARPLRGSMAARRQRRARSDPREIAPDGDRTRTRGDVPDRGRRIRARSKAASRVPRGCLARGRADRGECVSACPAHRRETANDVDGSSPDCEVMNERRPRAARSPARDPAASWFDRCKPTSRSTGHVRGSGDTSRPRNGSRLRYTSRPDHRSPRLDGFARHARKRLVTAPGPKRHSDDRPRER
jgi:hypothetical protein